MNYGQTMKEILHKGYRIVADQYLHYNCYYWEIYEGNVKVACTLDIDDRSYDSLDEALQKAQKELDAWIDGKNQFFFTPNLRVAV